MRGFAIVILIALFFWLVWPYIYRYLKRKAMEKTEDYLRTSMGLPPKYKKQKRKKGRKEEESPREYYQRRENPQGGRGSVHEPLIPKEYAEDVEFVEIREFSARETIVTGDKTVYHESQITDVEYTEIKKPRAK